VWRPLLPRLGYLLLPWRSSPAPWTASVSVLHRARREALPLVDVSLLQPCVGVSFFISCFLCLVSAHCRASLSPCMGFRDPLVALALLDLLAFFHVPVPIVLSVIRLLLGL
jgi:hypothetical protein